MKEIIRCTDFVGFVDGLLIYEALKIAHKADVNDPAYWDDVFSWSQEIKFNTTYRPQEALNTALELLSLFGLGDDLEIWSSRSGEKIEYVEALPSNNIIGENGLKSIYG